MVEVQRIPRVLVPDSRRVLTRPFLPGELNFAGSPSRVEEILRRVAALDDDQVEHEIAFVEDEFAGRHRDLDASWARHLELVGRSHPGLGGLDSRRLRLVGMVFTQEYAFESSAVCNPSMVPLEDPSPSGAQEFVMSVRSIGEGHLSSISFRSGRISADGRVDIDPASRWADNGRRLSPRFESRIFRERLREMGIDNEISARVLGDVSEEFSLDDLEGALATLDQTEVPAALRFETERAMHWLAASSYELDFRDVPLGERVLSPSSPAESRGMEDARFVRFVNGDDVVYYATYTAFDGFQVLPQIIETADFTHFRVATLAGSCARSKGMALFPRLLGGDYVALARTDGESTFVMRSDHLRRWDHAELVLRPTEPWEVVQAGNCGSPIETEEGWLVITHGVGPMRRYVISAMLLDLDEPTKLQARLTTPLLVADDDERDGYVPNVVYSCGAMVHGGVLVLPYGFSDRGIGIATVELDELLSSMV